ncbi:MAG: glycosyltransferase [bacterium]
MKLSIIIPAYNEEKYLRGCIKSVKAAVAAGDTSAEIIVCDNNSTDSTAKIAAEEGAKVVFEPENQISLSRNAGAKAASGDWFLFVDADSILTAETLGDMMEAAQSGRYAGGGCLVDLDYAPFHWNLLITGWNLVSRIFRLAAGSFIFCRADAFRETGGFSDKLYAAEEIQLSRDLKKWGKKGGLGFIILRKHPHVSSGRKARLYAFRELAVIATGILLFPWRVLRRKSSLGHLYDGRR